MVKKKSLLLLAFSFLALASCRFNVHQKDVIVKENILFNTLNNIDVRQTSFRKVFVDDGIIVITDEDENKLAELGARKIRMKDDWKHIGFQFMASGISTSCTYLDFETITTECFGTYLLALDENEKTLFDFLGNKLLNGIKLDSVCSVQNEVVIGDLGEKLILEHVLIDGKFYHFVVDKNLSRHALNNPVALYKNPEGNYCSASGNLYSIGYGGHMGQIDEDGLFRSDFGSEFNISSSNFASFCWKSVLSQCIETGSENEYDFAEEGKYYKIETKRTDVIDGNIHSFDFRYLINGSKHIYDENGLIRYNIIECNEIKNKLIDKKDRVFVVDNEFNIVFDATDNPKYSFDLERLNEYDYFSPASGAIFNYAGDLVFHLNGEYIAKSNQESLFLLTENNKYKIYNFDGEEIVELKDIKSANISTTFYRCGLLIDNNDQLVSLDMMNGCATNYIGYAADDVFDTGLGVLVRQTENEVALIGYNGEILTTSPGTLKNIYSINTPFHSDAFCLIDRVSYTSVISVSRA